MARYCSSSLEFKRQVAQQDLSGEIALAAEPPRECRRLFGVSQVCHRRWQESPNRRLGLSGK